MNSLQDLKSFEPVCKAISLMFPEMVEVVLHDLKTNRVAQIENGFSKRVVGDDSLIETENYASELRSDGTIGPYRKSSPDGSRIKSISAIIRDDAGVPIALLCINLKTGDLEAVTGLLGKLTQLEDESAGKSILRNDWRELANAVIEDALKEMKISSNQTRKAERLEIIGRLLQADVLSARGSGEYVAEALGVSRASFYAMLREVRNSEKDSSK